MLDTTRLAIFLAASLILALTPGPAVLFIVARSIHHGRKAGIASAIGIAIGSLLQVGLAAVGISALLLTSTLAYSIVRWLGAAYLCFLGLRAFFGSHDPQALDSTSTVPQAPAPTPTGYGRILRSGILVNLLNPKTALFFFSFLPQFVDPARGAGWLQTLILGAVFVCVAACTDSLYALVSGTLGGLLKGRRRLAFVNRWVSGAIYIGLGVVAAVSGERAK